MTNISRLRMIYPAKLCWASGEQEQEYLEGFISDINLPATRVMHCAIFHLPELPSTTSTIPVKSISVIVPVLNAGETFRAFLGALASQTSKPDRFIVLDSESTDDTAQLARDAGAEVIPIPRIDFNHGATRMVGALNSLDCDVLVFLTQDAILASDTSLAELVDSFDDDEVDIAYGRQLPRKNAGPIEAFARYFNYPDTSESRSASDIPQIGFKTCFCSNSFAAYRRERLLSVGGFPQDAIFGEDTLAAAKLILSGSVIRYSAHATVYHSHAYTLAEEFKRYFDIGVMHERSRALLKPFGSITSVGRSFVLHELQYLARVSPAKVGEALLRTCIKYLSYKLGRIESSLPAGFKARISMQKEYWTAVPNRRS